MNDATNSNEKKTDTVGSENINEKLSSAAKVIDDARAEARARLAQERKMREAQAKTDRARASELEAKNREDEKRIESVMAKKRAESEYAQSNRRSTEADKRRARAFADTEAAKKEMEKERLLREEAAKREREELLRRNAESDSLLSSVNRRVEESKNAAKARTSEEAELKRILFAAQVAKTEVKAEQKREEKELREAEEARRRASEEALEEQRALKLAEEARIRLEAVEKAESAGAESSAESTPEQAHGNETAAPSVDSAPSVNSAPSVDSASKEAAISEKTKRTEEATAMGNAEGTKFGDVIIQDGIEFIRGIPEEKPKNDNVTVIDGIEFIRGIPEVDLTRPTVKEENKTDTSIQLINESTSAQVPEEKPQPIGKTAENTASEKNAPDVESISIIIPASENFSHAEETREKEKVAEHTVSEAPLTSAKTEPKFDSILGSTYSMMTAKTGLEEKYEKKREVAEAAIRSSDDTYLPHAKATVYEEPKFKYEYDAGYIIKPKESLKKDKKSKKESRRKAKSEAPVLIAVPNQASEIYAKAPEVPEQASQMHAKTPETYAKAPEIYGQTEIKKPEAEETRVLATATDLNTGSDVKHTEAEEELFPSDARLQALIEEKQRKEHDIALLEAQSKKEAEALRERNRRAKAEYVSAQYSAKEEEYRRDIMALNARIREIESTRSATRDYYENSYNVYRSATEDSLYGKSALYDDTTSRSTYEFDSLPADDTEISDTPLYQNKKAAYYDEEIPEKNDKKKRKKKKAEKDELYSTDEFSKRNEKRAILDDYKAYNEKYGTVSDKKKNYADDYASTVNDREAELKKKYAKYFADDEDYGSSAQPVAEHKSDFGYPLVDESAVRISHESDPVSKNPESAPKSSKGYDKDDTYLAEDEDAFLEDAESITDVKAMKRRELNQHLKTAAKTEKRLKKAIKQEERKYSHISATEKPEKLIDVMSAKRDLFNLYVSNYMVCTASSDKKDARFFGKCAKQLVRDYNRDLSSYEKLTAQTQTHAENPVDYIKKHGTPPTLPLPAAEKDKKEDGAKASRKDRKREQLAYAKDYSDKRRKDKRGRKDAYAQAKQRIANDEQTVAARVDYRINKYDYEITRSKFRFGEETGADKRTRKRLLAKLKTMRTGRKSAIKREVENNARYLEVAVADANTVKRRRGAEMNDVRAVCERVSLLLTERDGINRRLNSLYRESESVFSASKNSRKRISELKLSVARRVFKSQLKEYRRVSKYPIPLKNKQPLYDAMNDKIELSSTRAELEYRLKSERPKGDVRAEMRERLRETKAELRRIDKDIPRLRKKITARVKRTDRPKHQFVWLLVLLLVAALGTVAFVFLKDEMIALFNKIWDFTMNIFKKNG